VFDVSQATVAAARPQEDATKGVAADVLVVFGITGDLAKVMTFRSLYRLERRGLLDCPIVGVAVDDWDVSRLRDRARESIGGTGEPLDPEVFDRFAARLSYVSGDFGDAASAAAVNAELHAHIAESQLYRIDHAVFRAMPDADPAHYVRGQYDGYLDVTGVRPDSTTETYAALRLEIDNWRWAGVPFYIRTGKLLPITQTEVRLIFKRPPRLGFVSTERREPEQLVVKLDPSTGVRMILDAHRAGEQVPAAITLDMEFSDEGGEGATPYEVLLHAAMQGDSASFTRQDSVEETWRIMQPLLDAPAPVQSYAPGTWGPTAADDLVAGSGRWHRPWVAS
jgi:glucose-6-phosphate 1-dehydrogenase